MDSKDDPKNPEARQLQVRVEFLEENNRWHLFALELLASLGEMHGGESGEDRGATTIFHATRKYLQRLIDFSTMAFFLVNEADASFTIADCDPETDKNSIQQIVDMQIEKGAFAWALKQNRALLVQDDASGEKLILNVLATKSRVVGMFVGKLAEKSRKIPAERLTLVSIILHNTANALESSMLYRIVSNHNRTLEETVRRRTQALERQTLELRLEIAERNRAEKALERLSRQNESILFSAGEGVIGLDIHENIIFSNPAASRILGFGVEEMTSRHLHDVLRSCGKGVELSKAKCPILEVLRGAPPFRVPDGAFRRKDGSRVDVEYVCNPILEEERIAGAVVVLKDIAERKKTERMLKHYASELQRSNQDLEDFAAIASHDLKEPLRKIISFSDYLRVNAAQNLKNRERDYLDRMQSAAGRMQKFIDDLLEYSKVSIKTRPFERTDLGQVIAEVLGDIEARLHQTKGHVEFAGLPTLEADKFQMGQLFQNLISNALKFHKENVPPVVKISAQPRDGGIWEILVADNGVGFDAKFADRIFKPFERLHGMMKFEGSGMGLAICRKIVDRHKGEIHADSAPDIGARFVIKLPEKQG